MPSTVQNGRVDNIDSGNAVAFKAALPHLLTSVPIPDLIILPQGVTRKGQDACFDWLLTRQRQSTNCP